VAEEDRARWNRRYLAEPYDFTPPEWLVRLAPRIRPGPKRPEGRSRSSGITTGRTVEGDAEWVNRPPGSSGAEWTKRTEDAEAAARTPAGRQAEPASERLAPVPNAEYANTQARALDLACGAGRNALFLAQLGYQVDAWDISDVAIKLLEQELAVRSGDDLHVHPRVVDLEAIELPADTYDLILDSHYLDRNLFSPMQRALRPGGLLVLRTFLQPVGGKYNPAHALEPGELRRVFGELIELEYAEDAEAEVAYLLAEEPSQRQ
jgi:SAM-dependent methyltransferase